MGVKKWAKKSFKDISQYKYLSCTHKYFDLLEQIKKNIPDKFLFVKDYFEILSGFAFKSTDYQEKGVKLCRIGDVSKSQLLLIENMERLPEEFVDRYKEYLIKKNDVLVGLTGDGKIFKTCYVSELKEPILLNQRVGILRAINDSFSPKLLSYVMQSDFVQNQLRIVGMGKTQKNISPFDVLKVKIPNISFDNQQQILATIAPFESEIASLKATKIPETDIINKVLGKELGLDWEKLKKIDQIKKVKINFSDLPTYNDTLRFSCRWNRAVEIQKELQNQFNQCEILGNHILKTQNGCSPTCGEEGDFQILGIDSISKSTVLSFENPKFTNDKITNFDKYVIHNNDFFVSRGNTIELVSLASIAEITDECRETIFPDLMIRITFDDKVDINYLAYIFNSLVGRLYFRNVTKGKNQTMVKVSEPELKKFIIPMPPKEKQSKIATLIKEQIDAQKIIDEQILKKQQQILQIIENAVR